MGAATDAKVEGHEAGVANGDGAATPQAPPPEEPPKMEEIVTTEVLQAIVKGYKPELKYVSFKGEPGSNIGDNYMSVMYALEIELENDKKESQEKLHVMLKNIPRNAMRAEMINEMNVFKKEALIYQVVFPDLINIQKEREVPKEHIYAGWPICYAVHLDKSTDYLAMENLKVAGYKMGNRILGLDYNHCALVLRDLARFHAISFAKYAGSREDIVKDYPLMSQCMFNPGSKTGDMQKQFMSHSFTTLADGFEKMGEAEPASRLRKLAASEFDHMMLHLVSDNIEYAVITHGDCWVNNILFKYDDPKATTTPASVKFLDFQLAAATSRLIDFYYFLMNSAKMDVLNDREEDLLLSYYSEFIFASQQLGVDTKEHGMSWSKFLKEADKFRAYGVFMGVLIAPMMSANADDIPDLEAMNKDEYETADGKMNDEKMKKFFTDITTGQAMAKVRNLVMNHLPKCEDLSAVCI